jgi:hypothetical protein
MSTLEIDVGDLHARSVEFTSAELVVTLVDGRRIATPLDWYPKLKAASAAARITRSCRWASTGRSSMKT